MLQLHLCLEVPSGQEAQDMAVDLMDLVVDHGDQVAATDLVEALVVREDLAQVAREALVDQVAREALVDQVVMEVSVDLMEDLV